MAHLRIIRKNKKTLQYRRNTNSRNSTRVLHLGTFEQKSGARLEYNETETKLKRVSALYLLALKELDLAEAK